MKNKYVLVLALALVIASCVSCTSAESEQMMTTLADARANPATFIDIGEVGDSVGDILTFDQPLLDEHGTVIGNNSGSCIRVLVAISFQCQWTLSFIDTVGVITGTVQVAGKEFNQGLSVLSIVGGTGTFFGVRGELESTNNNDSTFTQVLRYRL